ncbi:HET-domain-containing protein [Cucurbitaria berberidis CBS 394.84]|uniref:HET-domain-containing protein n=1 Tax=Cucurbitaria berberidis CBS 394.84 TaxID=1168544 RepID=A0A9P4G7G5_9PLEO|nr:HET-domain-containing protein [Cucurbitaria berberidis CBS 394.84]KAF1840326.1 HET-domain-containing protein [Cucurbitaria berberidis CBS 394.84]
MGRCDVCRERVILPLDRSKKTLLRIWSSGAELISLARSGCDFCTLFWQHLSCQPMEKLQVDKNEIYLYFGSKIHFELRINSYCLLILIDNVPELRDFTQECASNDPLVQAGALLRECLSSHSDCNDRVAIEEDQSVSRLALPRRLLDVSRGSTISVVDVQDCISLGLASTAEFSQYCTLSYRWGSAVHSCILSEPFTGHKDFSFEAMPQTFKDAIITARALSARFLWIDALCIVQSSAYGDDTDWSEEGPRMGVIYQGALFTIAATCAESTNDGFLSKVGTELVLAKPCEIPQHSMTEQVLSCFLNIAEPSLYSFVSKSELNSRGWVQQERVLSRRLLHFTKQGVFRECYQSPVHSSYGKVGKDYTQLQMVRATRSAKEMDLQSWLYFLQQYSKSNFTNSEDRLIALSSVVRTLHTTNHGEEYYAGLWSQYLVPSLLWYCPHPLVGSCAVRLAVAPSWSWASVTREIDHSTQLWGGRHKRLVEILGVSTLPVLSDNPYGNVKEGKLKLRGELISLSLPLIRDELSLLCWDMPHETSKVEQLYMVLPVMAEDWGFARMVNYHAIILEPLSARAGSNSDGHIDSTYRRIGIFLYRKADGWTKWKSKRRKHRRKVERDMRTITIV